MTDAAPARRPLFPVVTALAAATLGGCVERTLRVTSDPPGALVWVNDREIGRTPAQVDFTYYGTYDVRLALDGYEPLHEGAEANPPLWDAPGLDFFAEAGPWNARSVVEWHFVLEPETDGRDGLVERARDLRGTLDERRAEDPIEAPEAGGDDNDGSGEGSGDGSAAPAGVEMSTDGPPADVPAE